MQSLIIFASGNGTNAAAIIDYFRQNTQVSIALIVCNNPQAGVLNIARTEGIPFLLIDRVTFRETLFIEQLATVDPTLIVLAGFSWKLPDPLVAAFPDKIVNIHPALLPKYGGKGMYGHHVHEAVLQACERESGITIHFVNEHYDEGNIIVQARCGVESSDNAGLLAARIHRLEHFYYPRVIEFLLLKTT